MIPDPLRSLLIRDIRKIARLEGIDPDEALTRVVGAGLRVYARKHGHRLGKSYALLDSELQGIRALPMAIERTDDEAEARLRLVRKRGSK